MIDPNSELLKERWRTYETRKNHTLEQLREVKRTYNQNELLRDDPRLKPIPVDKNEIASFTIGGVQYPFSSFEQNVYFDGAPGSGKTKLMNIMLIQALTVLKQVGGVVIANDYKGDLYSKLKNYTSEQNIPFYYFNPTSLDSCIWDIAEDLGQDYYLARELLSTLIPKNKDGFDFWRESAVALAEGTTKVFMEKYPNKWGLHDVYNACLSQKEEVLQFMQQVQSNRYLLNNMLGNAATETIGGIQLTLFTAMQSVKLLANLQHHAYTTKKDKPKVVSLRRVLQQGGVLLFGQDNDKDYSAMPCIRAMFKFIGDYLVKKPNVPHTPDHFHTWIFWDELPNYGKLPRVIDLLNKGRDKKVSLFLVAQHFDQLKQIYDKSAEEFLQCSTVKFFLLSRNIENAKWKTEQALEAEMIRTSYTSTTTGSNRSFKAERIPQFRPEWFMGIPPFTVGVNLNGAMLTQFHGCVQFAYPNNVVMNYQIPDGKFQYIARPFCTPDFSPWNPNQTPLMGVKSLKDAFLSNQEGVSSHYQQLNTLIRTSIYAAFQEYLNVNLQ